MSDIVEWLERELNIALDKHGANKLREQARIDFEAAHDRIATLTEQVAGFDNFAGRMADQGQKDVAVIAALEAENELLRARVDLLEGVVEAARLNYNAQEIVFGMVERNQFFPFSDVTKAEEWLTHTHAELHVALAALDAATRSADTDGDEALGLHAPEAREPLAHDGASSARSEAVE